MNTLIRPLLTLMLSMSLMTAQGAMNYTARFDIDKLEVGEVYTNNVAYANIKYDGLNNTGETGAPSLPVKYVKLIVPYNAANISVTCTPSRSNVISLTNKVYPVQQDYPTSVELSNIQFTGPDSLVYTSNAPVPSCQADVVSDGFLYGENHIVTIAVSPVIYTPSSNTLVFSDEVELSVSFPLVASQAQVFDRISGVINVSNKQLSTNYLAAPTAEYRQSVLPKVISIVDNPEYIVGNAQNRSITTGGVSSDPLMPDTTRIQFPPCEVEHATVENHVNLGVYEYCVITTRELAPAFERLISWRRQKGYAAGVVCIEDILSEPYFRSGDRVSGINDDAGKLREYLRYAWRQKRGTQYVLFGGGDPIVPIRYGGSSDGIPSDVYFGDFNGNWNVNGNPIFGESYGDKVDFLPEIYVGRILCRSQQEVLNYTEKLIKYEINPGCGDPSYVVDGLFTITRTMEETYNKCVNFNTTRSFLNLEAVHELNNPNLIGTDIIKKMNNKRYGITSFFGHGAPGRVGVRDENNPHWPTWGILARNGYAFSCMKEYETANGLDCLTNYDFPQVSYSMSCTLMPFDVTYDEDSIPTNFGRSFTSYGKYGGPLFIGNTREGWFDGSFILLNNFFNLLKSEQNVARAEYRSKIGISSHLVKLAHNILGCPEIDIWTAIPSLKRYLLNITDNMINIGGNVDNKFSVGIASCNGATKMIETVDGGVTVYDMSPNSVVTIYGFNQLPNVLPVYFQNETISNRRNRFIVKDIAIGNSVATSRAKGDFVYHGGKLVIEADGDVVITDGFIAESAAEITIMAKGTVTITGGIVKDGSILTINSPSVNITKNFTTASGGQLNINNPIN